jgi:hypothetical protein
VRHSVSPALGDAPRQATLAEKAAQVASYNRDAVQATDRADHVARWLPEADAGPVDASRSVVLASEGVALDIAASGQSSKISTRAQS